LPTWQHSIYRLHHLTSFVDSVQNNSQRASVVLIIADGIRLDTLQAALDDGSLPSMARLRDEGGLHTLTTVFPSVTGPAYVPFLMGCHPGKAGIPGLRWFDRAGA